ncbi:peptidase C1 [bacterium]|nr:peptidase C1 [bacterium]
MLCRSFLLFVLLTVAAGAHAQDAVYRARNEYPVLDEMTAAREAEQAVRDSIRAAVDARYAAEAEARKNASRDLRIDWSGIEAPRAPAEFATLWHNPPVPQYYTGTCWAFGSVSLLESEARRLAGVEVKLSEMWIVYWEYVEKARSYLQEFGHTPVEQGGQDHGTLEIAAKYGVVTHEAYPGVLAADGRHDHRDLIAELKGYLEFALEAGITDLDRNLQVVRGILDAYLGPVPATVVWQGTEYAPKAFLQDVLKIDPAAYESCVSRMDTPFGERVLLDVTDNWRRKDDYLNLPLEDFSRIIKDALKNGFTVAIGGDNSEPGMDGLYDKAIIPEWDIPSKSINQASREFRIVNRTTGDDHGVHLVGFKRLGGRDWYLVKDSNRSSRLGEHKGYYFWDGDYIKLKMLSFTVHRDALGKMLR